MDDFQAEFEKNGAYCNASTGVYDITYEAECADFEWERIMELLLMAICEPLFLDEEFLAEMGNVREEFLHVLIEPSQEEVCFPWSTQKD